MEFRKAHPNETIKEPDYSSELVYQRGKVYFYVRGLVEYNKQYQVFCYDCQCYSSAAGYFTGSLSSDTIANATAVGHIDGFFSSPE